MKRYFTSDLHFFDTGIIGYCDRPYLNLEEMHRELGKNFLNATQDAEEIYLLGDICTGLSAQEAGAGMTIEHLKEAAALLGVGAKPFYLLRGNHDLLLPNFYLDAGFSSISMRLEMEVAGYKALLCHDPSAAQRPNTLCICGHLHHLFREYYNPERNILVINVGVDVRGYKPVSEDEIADIIERRRFDPRGIPEDSPLPLQKGTKKNLQLLRPSEEDTDPEDTDLKDTKDAAAGSPRTYSAEGVREKPDGEKNLERMLHRLMDFNVHISSFVDMSTILDAILTETRDAASADAGTIYLAEQGQLRFACVQNDTLFTKRVGNVQNYVDILLPLDDKSIVGHVALSRKTLNLPDVANLPDDAPYSFNRSFDEENHYRTVSMLTIPIVRVGGETLGIIQLLNSKDENGKIQPFSEEDNTYVHLLAMQILAALERAIMSRHLIQRTIQLATLHDPMETGAHVKRVGAYSAEIYNYWAARHGVPSAKAREMQDKLKLAAMLHDIGKIGISDKILKKPGRLTLEERAAMEKHCALGARIYEETRRESLLEAVAYNVTLHHHQKWNGKGYTGSPDIALLSGEDIPLEARIVSVADVFDALTSKRSYKDAWTFEAAFAELTRLSGKDFDPEIIEFLPDLSDTFRAIRNCFADENTERK
ncbi:MAG: HD domain-containing protein [Synergistaceae bacterium]|nr:HD domain-containing protein [Synergistaceae bacterium]